MSLKQYTLKKNKSVLKTITFYLEDDDDKEVYFNGETLTFTLQSIKILKELILHTQKMSFQKFKTNSYCVGSRHQPATTNIYADITSKVSKVLIGDCSTCKRNKSMTVTDNTTVPHGLGDFFKSLGEKGLNVSKRW